MHKIARNHQAFTVYILLFLPFTCKIGISLQTSFWVYGVMRWEAKSDSINATVIIIQTGTKTAYPVRSIWNFSVRRTSSSGHITAYSESMQAISFLVKISITYEIPKYLFQVHSRYTFFK